MHSCLASGLYDRMSEPTKTTNLRDVDDFIVYTYIYMR